MFSFSNKYKEYYNFVIFAKNKSNLKKGKNNKKTYLNKF